MKKTSALFVFYFVVCYLFILTLSPPLVFLFEGALALLIFRFISQQKQPIFVLSKPFRFQFKHILWFCFVFLSIFFLTFGTKPGFFFFFMAPLGYFLNKERFIALCILYYLLLLYIQQNQQNDKGMVYVKSLLSGPGRCIGIWLIGVLCVLSTLHGKKFLKCPSPTSIYDELLSRSFCEGNFFAQEACRHDNETVHGMAVYGKKRIFYFAHPGRGDESPLCMYSPKDKYLHKTLPYKASARRVIFNPQDNTLILPLLSKPRVLIIDAQSLKIKKIFKLSSNLLMDAVLDEKKNTLYVLSENSSIHKINLSTGKIKEAFFRKYAGANAYALGMNTFTQTLYVSSWLGGTLCQINAKNLKFIQMKRFFPSLMGIDVDEGENEVYVARPYPPAILVLDGFTLKLKKKLQTDFGTRSVLYIKEKKLLTVGNYFAGTVQFFDTQTKAEVFKFHAGQLLRGLAYDTLSQYAFSYSGCGIYKFPLSKIYPLPDK